MKKKKIGYASDKKAISRNGKGKGNKMKEKNIMYKGKELKRINAKKVDNLLKKYKEHLGLIIYTAPVNMNPESVWGGFFEIELNEYNDYYNYIHTINEIQYYNCIEELGNYLKFYIEVK